MQAVRVAQTRHLFHLTQHITFMKIIGPVVAVDGDAEAPDLLLSLGGSKKNLFKRIIIESRKARINEKECISCCKCYEACQFQAIYIKIYIKNNRPVITEEYCEGCGARGIVCPD